MFIKISEYFIIVIKINVWYCFNQGIDFLNLKNNLSYYIYVAPQYKTDQYSFSGSESSAGNSR